MLVMVMVMFVVLMVVVTAAAMLVMVMVMFVVLMVVMAAATVFIVVMMVVLMLFYQLCNIFCQSCLASHCLQQLRTGKLIPRSGHNGSFCIMRTKHFHSRVQFLLGNGICTGQDDGRCGFNLIIIELTKVLHIHFDLTGIHNGNGIAKCHFRIGHFIHSCDHIGKLAYAGRLDHNAVRRILCDHLC